jgi:hypothetical protein
MKRSSKEKDMKGKVAKKVGIAIISTAIIATLGVGSTAFAQSTTATATSSHQGWMPGSNGGARRAPGVFGTVSAISGDSITITSKGYGASAASKTYTVDATNATVTKANAASSVSAIALGDTLMVQGTVSGTSVTATKIMDGMMMGGKGMGMMGHGMASSTMAMHTGMGPGAMIAGNGDPVIGGTVTAESGSSLTVTNKSNVTYTVDASSATVIKGNATSSASAIATGDNVVVQGTVNGTAVVASSIMDQGAAPSDTSATGTKSKGGMGGLLGNIGGFIHSLFGFF